MGKITNSLRLSACLHHPPELGKRLMVRLVLDMSYCNHCFMSNRNNNQSKDLERRFDIFFSGGEAVR